VAYAGECAARMVAFNNLGDDLSPDARKTPSPKRTREKHPPPPPHLRLVSAGSNVSFADALPQILECN
jgi:hypothetical protein